MFSRRHHHLLYFCFFLFKPLHIRFEFFHKFSCVYTYIYLPEHTITEIYTFFFIFFFPFSASSRWMLFVSTVFVTRTSKKNTSRLNIPMCLTTYSRYIIMKLMLDTLLPKSRKPECIHWFDESAIRVLGQIRKIYMFRIRNKTKLIEYIWQYCAPSRCYYIRISLYYFDFNYDFD